VSKSVSDDQPVEDLWQIKDRHKWYEAKFAADDQPDWQPASLISSEDVGPGLRELTLDVETSREIVPLRNSYKFVGQKAAIRVQGGTEHAVFPTCPPFPAYANKVSLLKVRGDLSSGQKKLPTEEVSERETLKVLVSRENDPELYAAGITELFELGPFQNTALDLQKGVQAVYRYPTVVMFVSGEGIATAKALLTAKDRGLEPELREAVRMYYKVGATCIGWTSQPMCIRCRNRMWE